jgi:D-amino peptidase
MDVYMVMDMEGISGVSGEAVVRVGHQEWAGRGRKLATADVNAAVDGVRAAGARRIWVNDGHAGGDQQNVLIEELHAAAELVTGSGSVWSHMPGLDKTFGAVLLVGFHARMGTHRAQMDHTITTAAVHEVRLNGTPVGEIGIYAAYAGLHGIPVVLVTGDLAATREATALLGEITTVAVQEAYGRFSGRLLAPQEAHRRIRGAAAEALKQGGRPWSLERPYTVAVDFLRSAEADMAEFVPGARRAAARTVEYAHDDPEMTFKALKAMVALGGSAAHKWATAIYTTGSRVV